MDHEACALGLSRGVPSATDIARVCFETGLAAGSAPSAGAREENPKHLYVLCVDRSSFSYRAKTTVCESRFVMRSKEVSIELVQRAVFVFVVPARVTFKTRRQQRVHHEQRTSLEGSVGA